MSDQSGTFAHVGEISVEFNLAVGDTLRTNLVQTFTGSINLEEVGAGRGFITPVEAYTTNGVHRYINQTPRPQKVRLRVAVINDGVDSVDYTMDQEITGASGSSIIPRIYLRGSGPPTSGASGTGAGVAGPGSAYEDSVGVGGKSIVYDQIGTLAVPSWAPRQLGDSV
jgi:hypothetical protein